MNNTYGIAVFLAMLLGTAQAHYQGNNPQSKRKEV